MGMLSEWWKTCSFSLWCGPYVHHCTSPATHLTRLNMCGGFIGDQTARVSQRLWPQTTWCAAREAKEFISDLLASSSITVLLKRRLFTSWAVLFFRLRSLRGCTCVRQITVPTTECFLPSRNLQLRRLRFGFLECFKFVSTTPLFGKLLWSPPISHILKPREFIWTMRKQWWFYCQDDYVQQSWTPSESFVHFWSRISSKKPHGVLALCFVKQGPLCFFVFLTLC